MKIGLNLPQIGPLADPTVIRRTAVAAEAAGYSSLWVLDRILRPVAPRTPYPGSPDGQLPAEMGIVLDPIGTLTLAAAVTERIGLGTSVLVAPWYPPVLLARSLATLDLISAGRLTVGLGVGWSADEYDAVAVPMVERGARLEEALDVLDAVWTQPTVSYRGVRVQIAPSQIDPKPHQAGGPPVLLGAYTPAALDRIARRARGWTPAGLPPELIGLMWAGVRDAAAGYGRDPQTLQLVVRANLYLTERPIDGDRPSWSGTPEQIADDLAATARLGADEVVLAIGTGDADLDGLMVQIDAVVRAAGLPVDSLALLV